MPSIKKNTNDKHIAESYERELAKLIKEAGEVARARRKKAMDEHFQKLHTALTGTLPLSQPNKMP
jgi:NTP pyrophosphatase (non-canonical NTP hydrolase)